VRTTHFVFSARRPGPALAGLFVMGLLPAAPLAAQELYNQGETISVSAGAVLSVPNGYEQTTGATLLNAGTTTITGSVRAATSATLNLSYGDLTVTGDVVNAGTTAATAFSQWTVFSDAANVLPVELLPFGATRAGSAARLTWATASEKNSAYFEVEASLSGYDFRPVAAIGRVAAQGTSAVRHEYAALDPDLGRYGAALVYYRLRQTDRDGALSLSDVRALRVGEASGPLTAVAWPDPSAPVPRSSSPSRCPPPSRSS
jgi:hypothetical protein